MGDPQPSARASGEAEHHVINLGVQLPPAEDQDMNPDEPPIPGGLSAFHVAAFHGLLTKLQWLCDRLPMADLNLQDNKGNTPLHYAVLQGHKGVARFLVSREGVSLAAFNEDGMMPVSYCQDPEMFQALFWTHARSAQLDVKNKKDAAGKTILHYVAQYATESKVIAMFISGTESDKLEMRDSDQKDSFLDVAAKAGNMAVLEALKEVGLHRIDMCSLISDEHGFHKTGLYALLHNHREFFDGLISMCKVEITLSYILRELRKVIVDDPKIRELLKKDRVGDDPKIRELLKKDPVGDDPEKKDSLDETLPTYLALWAKSDLLFEFLLKTTDLTVNQWDGKHKRTCLHWSVIHDRKDIAEKLCKNGHLRPSASIEDGDGKTALQHAFENKNNEMMEILRGRPDFKNHEEKLNRDREVYVQVLNSILVGAALIASVTFAGWLQLPSGSVFKSLGLKVFWASNSLSFYSAVATMCVTLGALIPTPTRYVQHIVRQLRLAICLDASLLALSLASVIWAFAAAGFAALHNSHVSEYQANMRGTTIVGGILCATMWLGFVLQLYRFVPSFNTIFLTLLSFAPWPANQPVSLAHRIQILTSLLHFLPWVRHHIQNIEAQVGDSSRCHYPSMSRKQITKITDVDLVVRYHDTQLVPADTRLSDIKTYRRSLQIPDKQSFARAALS